MESEPAPDVNTMRSSPTTPTGRDGPGSVRVADTGGAVTSLASKIRTSPEVSR